MSSRLASDVQSWPLMVMATKPGGLAHMSVAWDAEAETLVEMPPQGDETVVGPIRKQCRAGRIICGVAGCVDPRLTTIFRPGRWPGTVVVTLRGGW